jgi:hypothetical protein
MFLLCFACDNVPAMFRTKVCPGFRELYPGSGFYTFQPRPLKPVSVGPALEFGARLGCRRKPYLSVRRSMPFALCSLSPL